MDMFVAKTFNVKKELCEEMTGIVCVVLMYLLLLECDHNICCKVKNELK